MSTWSGATLHRCSEIGREQVTDTLSRRIVTGQRLMLTHVYLGGGVCRTAPLARERADELHTGRGAAVRGRGGGGGDRGRAGEVLHIPAGVPPSAVALEESLSVDVFSPPRQDWLDGTDDYLRR